MAQTFRRTQFCGPQAFKTGDLWDLLFDGTNIWISHQGDGHSGPDGPLRYCCAGHVSDRPFPNTARLRRGHSLGGGQRQHDYETERGESVPPCSASFDGANVWVTNMGSNTMTQIRATDGKVLGLHPTGPNPVSIVFDGTRLWVANSGSNTVTKYPPGVPLPEWPAST